MAKLPDFEALAIFAKVVELRSFAAATATQPYTEPIDLEAQVLTDCGYDIGFAVKQEVDYLGLSFVRRAADVRAGEERPDLRPSYASAGPGEFSPQ